MYNSRTWLNPINSDSTGSVVAYDGEVTDLDSGKKYPHTFLEISDCRGKARLHLTSDDTKEQFIEKMKMLKYEIELFINHLEKMETSRKIFEILQYAKKNNLNDNDIVGEGLTVKDLKEKLDKQLDKELGVSKDDESNFRGGAWSGD